MTTKRKLKTVLILAVLFSIIVYLYKNAVYMVTESAVASFSAYSSLAFYEAEKAILTEEKMKGVVTTVYDDSGNIVYVGVDALKVNVLAEELSAKTLEEYEKFISGGVEINSGAFSGIKLLAASGDKVKIKIVSVSSVRCDFRAEYVSLGINQTLRRLYLTVQPSYNVILPFYKLEGVSSIEYLVYDELILGRIPEIYLSGSFN